MKVISGKLKGRIIKGFDIEGTRPTMDRVKESIFGMIQDYLVESLCLDLFAGSGNLGIEAISNGAKICYFNDYNKKCIRIIKDNLINFNILDNSIVTDMDYKKALSYYKNKRITFDLIFLDPPYREDIINEILMFIENNNLLNKNGLVVCESTKNIDYQSKKINLFKQRNYGDKMVFIYKLGE